MPNETRFVAMSLPSDAGDAEPERQVVFDDVAGGQHEATVGEPQQNTGPT
jgi:hypothetical protein